jgi:hypothetical protein
MSKRSVGLASCITYSGQKFVELSSVYINWLRYSRLFAKLIRPELLMQLVWNSFQSSILWRLIMGRFQQLNVWVTCFWSLRIEQKVWPRRYISHYSPSIWWTRNSRRLGRWLWSWGDDPTTTKLRRTYRIRIDAEQTTRECRATPPILSTAPTAVFRGIAQLNCRSHSLMEKCKARQAAEGDSLLHLLYFMSGSFLGIIGVATWVRSRKE